MNYWLAKTEPSVYSIDDLKKDKVTMWDSIRNYQARNFLKEMEKGDFVFVYHSNADPTGVAGLAKVVKTAYPDPTQFDKKDKYFDPKATKDNPRWFCPDMKFDKKFKEVIELATLREVKALKDCQLLKRGNRLSVMPISEKEAKAILKIA